MRLAGALALLALRAAPARGEEHHPGHDGHDGHDGSHAAGHPHEDGLAASLGALMATYEAALYDGHYEGLVATLAWTRASAMVGASFAAYRIERNGKSDVGAGDLLLHAHAMVWRRGDWSAGAMLMGSLPTGDAGSGLGMGHVMIMPHGSIRWGRPRLAAEASLGYAYAFGGAMAHAQHGGMWPLVEPMNMSELTWAAEVTVAASRRLGLAARATGGVPVGEGRSHAFAAGRVFWRAGRTQTSLDLQAGVVGDPFVVRGVVETTVRFDGP